MFNIPRGYKPAPNKYLHITKEHLQAEIDAGKTVDQIAEDNSIVRGTMSALLKRHGLSGNKRGARR